VLLGTKGADAVTQGTFFCVAAAAAKENGVCMLPIMSEVYII
jgi:hypothetical protein